GLERELPNLRAALDGLIATAGAHPERAEQAMRLCGALHWFWYGHGHLSEGRRWAEAALAASDGRPTRARARTMHVAAGLAWRQGDLDRAEALSEARVALNQELGDKAATAQAVRTLAQVAWNRGDLRAARALAERSVAL